MKKSFVKFVSIVCFMMVISLIVNLPLSYASSEADEYTKEFKQKIRDNIENQVQMIQSKYPNDHSVLDEFLQTQGFTPMEISHEEIVLKNSGGIYQ